MSLLQPHSLPRLGMLSDAKMMAAIYNEGIADRVATFETSPRSEQDIRAWFDGRHPIVVVERDGEIIAFASTSTYRPRDCYAGIAEVSVYVARAHRKQGAGRTALKELIQQAQAQGFWKLVSRVFPENKASRALVASLGFEKLGFTKSTASSMGNGAMWSLSSGIC